MAAGQARQLEHHGRQRADFRRQRQPDIGPRAARTADGEDALILRVDVQKPPRRERRDVETRRALHADLFVDREDRLDARMAERFVIHRSERHRDGNAVVAAERRAAGVEIIAVQREVESVARHVQRAVRRFFRDHVEMALDDDRLGAFAAGRGRADDDDVVQRVLMDFEAVTFCKADAIVGDGFRVAGAVRNGTEIGKIRENGFRLQRVGDSHGMTSLYYRNLNIFSL